MLTQISDGGLLVIGEAFLQRIGVAIVLDQLLEGMVAFMHLQRCINHGDRG
ncbi:hypothetical protein D3C79_1118810 [compost metagenome]